MAHVHSMPRCHWLEVVVLASLGGCATALDNGVRLPPMGWSSWYGFTQNIDETMLRGMASQTQQTQIDQKGNMNIWI